MTRIQPPLDAVKVLSKLLVKRSQPMQLEATAGGGGARVTAGGEGGEGGWQLGMALTLTLMEQTLFMPEAVGQVEGAGAPQHWLGPLPLPAEHEVLGVLPDWQASEICGWGNGVGRAGVGPGRGGGCGEHGREVEMRRAWGRISGQGLSEQEPTSAEGSWGIVNDQGVFGSAWAWQVWGQVCG